MKKYSHEYDIVISFIVETNTENEEKVTMGALRKALKRRLEDFPINAMLKSCEHIDTFENENIK